jgi:hypothetical protein
VILLGELTQAVEEASAIANRIMTLAGEMQELSAVPAPTAGADEPQAKS